MSPPRSPLWNCPKCGAGFTTRNQRHSCGRFELAPLFARSDPSVRRVYEAFAASVASCGPVTVIPQRTRIAFQARMRFAAVTPGRDSLRGHLILAERHELACFQRVITFGARSHQHLFRLERPAQIDARFERLVRAAYRVGLQEHLAPPPVRYERRRLSGERQRRRSPA